MLNYYRRMDNELHTKIGLLVKELATTTIQSNSIKFNKYNNYIPELES